MEITSIFTKIGLTTSEVEERIAKGKVNGEQTVKTKSIPQILRTNILTFFNFVFVVVAIILSVFVTPDASGFGNFGFLFLVIINSSIGIIQEIKAKKTIDKLSLLSAPKVTVIRDGSPTDIAIKDIVLDDITVLSTGGQICADAVIVDGCIEVNESLITGEPDAVLKNIGDKVMSGSFVVSGKADAEVMHVGLDNFAMKISAGAKYLKKPNSAIWRSLMLIVKIMAFTIVPLGIALFCIKYLVQDGANLANTVVTTVGSVIGMIPSGLVALSSAVFCISVIRLAKNKTLAQDMYCIETLARVDVLCLDKTGTITEGSMEVNSIHTKKDLSEFDFKQILKNLMTALKDDNATANAIKTFVADFQTTFETKETVPFSSQRKWSGAYLDGRSYVLGAPEFVFPIPKPEITKVTEEMAEKGFRVLVLASSKNHLKNSELPSRLVLEGFVFITDKIRPEAPDTLRFFKEQGVIVKIISGDNPSTVRAVAMRAGLTECDNIIDMSTLKTDKEVIDAAENFTIFGRVLPNQKLLLIKALKANGHTVAMTGDGVNDVLALKEADCSIAMASGSDAAKNVSSIVLMDSNFASMPKIVAEGRRSINNLERSASLFLVKSLYNFILALLFMIVSSELPFAPKHLTFIGAVTIGIPSFILALEPNNQRVTGRFLPKVLANALPGAFTVVLGVVAVLICDHFFLELTVGRTQSLYLIITTFVGFMYLFKVCLPFNFLHAAIFIVMLSMFVGAYFINVSFFDMQAFFGLSKDLTWPMGQAILAIIAVLIPIFCVLCFVTNKLSIGFNKMLDNKSFKKQTMSKLAK